MSISRDEFQSRLNFIFDPASYFSNEEAIENLYTNDGNRIPWMNTIRSNMKSLIDGYLAQYDAASTDEERDAIVGSVSNSYVAPAKPAADPGKYFGRRPV